MNNNEKNLHEMIDEIEDFVDDGKISRLNPGKVVLEKDILITMLEDLRTLVPSELERSHKIVMTKESIIDDAKVKADKIIQEAIKEASATVEQHEIVKLAKKRSADMERDAKQHADELLRKAKADAKEIRLGAMEYTSDMMEGLEAYMVSLKEAQTSIYSQLLDGIAEEIKDVHVNSREIKTQISAVMKAGKDVKK
ncbi:MAG: hypothetical protein UHS41_10425 [Lachnospiraceae bacterium]|nr:hypothetical protein [Lachnospiraceae bacterium]